ncbi:hypothetical protein P8452_56832 [Trifolium repens]|nr:hypothetical protein P8452_56832 [Trifolium repens]
MDSEKRRTLPLKVKLPDLKSLRDLTTPEYRTMNEGKGPFVEIGHPPAVKKLAEALNIGVLEFANNVTTKGKVPGFLRSYLEEKAHELKATIAQLNKEKEELQASLLKATQENCELKWERVQKDKIIEDSNKRLRIEGDEGLKVRNCLGGANSQLKHKNKERNELLSIAYKLKDQWEKSQVDVKELKEELENARQHLNNMVNEYEGYVSSERLQREALERTLVRSQFELKKAQESLEEFRKFNDRQGEAYENLKKESEKWERRYMKLVNSVESGTLFRILRHEGVHWKTDATMHPLNTPSEVVTFVEFCKTMMRDFREKMNKI